MLLQRFPKAAYLLFLAFFCSFLISTANPPKQSREAYIGKYAEDAVREMKRTGIPASITLAQGCLESSDGNSPLALEANNHFGIKCANWNGPGFYQDDDAPNECFRKYNSALESFDDHSEFLRSRPRYASLFELKSTDYKGWAHGLKHAGYATDPQYAHRLIKIIEDYNLQQYDSQVVPAAPVASTRPVPIVEQVKRTLNFHASTSSSETVSVFGDREVMTNNGSRYIIARRGDNFKNLSEEFQLGYWQLPKYNELPMSAKLQEGQHVYISPKQRNASVKTYTVKEGDTIHSIAQDLGIKSKFIRKYNQLQADQRLATGQELKVGL